MGKARGTVGTILKTYLNPFQVLRLLEKCTESTHSSEKHTVHIPFSISFGWRVHRPPPPTQCKTALLPQPSPSQNWQLYPSSYTRQNPALSSTPLSHTHIQAVGSVFKTDSLTICQPGPLLPPWSKPHHLLVDDSNKLPTDVSTFTLVPLKSSAHRSKKDPFKGLSQV